MAYHTPNLLRDAAQFRADMDAEQKITCWGMTGQCPTPYQLEEKGVDLIDVLPEFCKTVWRNSKGTLREELGSRCVFATITQAIEGAQNA